MRVPGKQRAGHFTGASTFAHDRIIRPMHGAQLTADLHGCAADRPAMTDPATLRAACIAAIDAAGLTPVGELFHRFDGASIAGAAQTNGITGVVLLAESHVAVHTWPELGAVTLDVYVCNVGRDNTARAQALLATLIDLFEPARVERQALQRGAPAAAAAATP